MFPQELEVARYSRIASAFRERERRVEKRICRWNVRTESSGIKENDSPSIYKVM
jgi:hypothetical protein